MVALFLPGAGALYAYIPAMLMFLFSLGAIYATIPVIIIIILILAARGTRGQDIFAMFGINTLLSTRIVGGGITRPSSYKTSKRTADASKSIGGFAVGHQGKEVAPFGWKKDAEGNKLITEAGDPVARFGIKRVSKQGVSLSSGIFNAFALGGVTTIEIADPKKAAKAEARSGTSASDTKSLGAKSMQNYNKDKAQAYSIMHDLSDADMAKMVTYFGAGMIAASKVESMGREELDDYTRRMIFTKITLRQFKSYVDANTSRVESKYGVPPPMQEPGKGVNMSVGGALGYIAGYPSWLKEFSTQRKRYVREAKMYSPTYSAKKNLLSTMSEEKIRELCDYYGLKPSNTLTRDKLVMYTSSILSQDQISSYLKSKPKGGPGAPTPTPQPTTPPPPPKGTFVPLVEKERPRIKSAKSTGLYAILGITNDASDDEIKSAYRKLAQEYHPDRNPGDKVAEEKFKRINDAYDTLGRDKEKKKKYDDSLKKT